MGKLLFKNRNHCHNHENSVKQRPILQNRLYLYLTEFFAGMSVMATELGASRLLAPYFSSSQIVWTIIIGTIMIAMALGNIYGGRSADKNPNPDKLYGRMLIASIWIGAIPVVGKYIILGISAIMIFSVNQYFLIWAAFAACMALFVFPLFLLGTVTPSLVKYSVDSLDQNGRTVGALGAANTIGSIIGTFLPTFVTIPTVGTSITFLIFSGILLLLAVIYFVSGRCGFKKTTISAALFLACCILGNNGSFAFWEQDLVYEGESIYNYLQVKEGEDDVILSTNVMFGVQSILKKDNELTGMYYDYAMLAPFMTGAEEKERLDVLILGMGSGTYATQCSRYFDNLCVEGVEIDQKITRLAHQYFKLPKSVNVVTYDGRAYLNANKKTYDIIMVDAYQDITIPFQMSSFEFFTLVKEHLKEDGVMAVNMNMQGGEEGNINQYLSDTIANVFEHVYTVDVSGSTNRELFASSSSNLVKTAERNLERMRVSAKDMNDFRKLELTELMFDVSGKMQAYEKGAYLLTDDKAPVELLGMKVIDDLIKEEIAYYRDIYDRQGIAGLLESVQQ